MSNIKKLCLSGIFVAVGILGSSIYIPIGIAKCMPIQHVINVLGGVILGPIYSVLVAFSISLIRLLLGTGSMLAFPGSMIGALLCGIIYKYTKNELGAFFGEIIGTGLIGAVLAYPIATIFMAKEGALLGFVIPFSVSSFGGAIIALTIILAIKKTNMIKYYSKQH